MSKSKSKLPISVAELERAMVSTLATQTKALVAAEPVASLGNIVRVKNRKFYYGDEQLPDKLRVVVLATAAYQAYYETDYDPDVKSSPVCFALSPTEAELVPDDRSPKKQFDGPCLKCPQNQPGSGAKGGYTRACSLKRRVAFLFVDDKTDEPQWASVELSVTALKAWSAYVRGLAATHSLPYYAAVTELGFVDDKKGDYWHVDARYVDKLSAVRPDWLVPEKGVKVGSEGWFDTTLVGRQIRAITEGKLLLTPPSPSVEEPKSQRRKVSAAELKKQRSAATGKRRG